MLTTKEVRAIMRKHGKGRGFELIYTNKVKDPNVRHVKCYYSEHRDHALMDALCIEAGYENVKLTMDGHLKCYSQVPGLIVKCKMA